MRTTFTACIASVGLIVVLGTLGCQKPAPKAGDKAASQPENKAASEVGYGTLAGHTYTNDYFGLTISIPDDWYIQSREEAEELSRIGTAAATAKGANQNLKAAMEASQTRTFTLVSAFRHPPGTPGLFNSSVIILAERVKHLPGIRSGAEYCAQMKQGLEMTAMKYEFDAVESGLKIGSLDAHCLPARMNVGVIEVRQRYYATRYKDYVLALIVSYSNDAEREEAEKILADIKAGGK